MIFSRPRVRISVGSSSLQRGERPLVTHPTADVQYSELGSSAGVKPPAVAVPDLVARVTVVHVTAHPFQFFLDIFPFSKLQCALQGVSDVMDAVICYLLGQLAGYPHNSIYPDGVIVVLIPLRRGPENPTLVHPGKPFARPAYRLGEVGHAQSLQACGGVESARLAIQPIKRAVFILHLPQPFGKTDRHPD